MPEQLQTPAQAAPDALPAFSLALPPQRVLPTALISAADGRAYPIDADFRTVLACLRRLEDPERDALQKRLYLAKRFFGGNPPPDMDALFLAFIAGGAPAREEAPLMHFERDAGAIYASFLQQYGLDLLTVRLHWVAFRELLAGLNENTALGARVRLRALDETALPPEERARVRRLKEQLALPACVSRAEQALLAELDRRLAAGEDPADVLTQLREV